MAKEFAKAFYKSKAWQCAREYALKRDCYRCVECGRAAEEVHHIEYLRPENINNPAVTVSPSNLMSLCFQCHKAKHQKQNECEVTYYFDSNGNITPR